MKLKMKQLGRLNRLIQEAELVGDSELVKRLEAEKAKNRYSINNNLK